MMMKQLLLPIALIALLPLILKLLFKLRLGLAVVYVVLANTLWLDWASQSIGLSNGILFCTMGLAVISWLVTGYRKLAAHFGFSKVDRQREQLLSTQLRMAKADSIPREQLTVEVVDGLPMVRYE